jgi:predicted amidophosphoribosyltransferase
LNLIRIDSCRKCGKELQITKLCNDCQRPLHFDCSNCNLFIDDQIHQHEILLMPLIRDNVFNAITGELRK